MELLVVIAIIAVLTTLGAAVYLSASSKSKSVKSISQLHQIATAIAGYIGENSGRYPPGWYQTTNLSHVEYLNVYLYDSDYIVQDSPFGTGMYLPPEQRGDSVFISPFRKGIDTSARWAHNHTYGPNPNVMPEIFDGDETRTVHETRVTRPSEIIIYADMWTNEQGDGAATFANQPGVNSGGGQLDQPVEVVLKKLGALHYYNGKLHAIMGDLSVRTFKEGQVLKRNIVLADD